MGTKRFLKTHLCQLPRETRLEFILQSPYDSWYYRVWIWIRNHITLNRNFESVTFFRSHAAFDHERRRHLENPNYKWVLHPFSNFVIWKDIIMSFLWMSLFILESFLCTFVVLASRKKKRIPFVENSILVGNVIVIVDAISRFFTGYITVHPREIVLEPRSVACRYLKTYCFFDFGAAVGYIIYLTVLPYVTEKTLLILYQLHRLRLIRLRIVSHNVTRFLTYFEVHEGRKKLIELAILALIIMHALSSLSSELHLLQTIYNLTITEAWMNKYSNESQVHLISNKFGPFHLYLRHVAVVACHFLGAETSSNQVSDTANSFVFSCVLIFGVFFHAYCLAKMLEFFGVSNISELKFDEIILQVENYMHRREFPRTLKARINTYYEYKFNRKFFNEKKIMDSFSEHLRMEVLLYSCQSFLRQVQIFRGLSKDATGTILALLKQDIFVSRDKVIDLKDDNGSIFFILRGTCEIRAENGREVMHVEDGDHFSSLDGVDAAMSRTKRPQSMYTVTALEVAEVYILELEDVRYICNHHPQIGDKLDAVLAMSARKILTSAGMTQDQHITTADILERVREGKVLHAGLHRSLFH